VAKNNKESYTCRVKNNRLRRRWKEFLEAGVAQSVWCLDYRLDERGSIPGRGKDLSSSLCVQTSSDAHPASFPTSTGSKARPRCDANHPLPYNDE
jgi:hypothetical protein